MKMETYKYLKEKLYELGYLFESDKEAVRYLNEIGKILNEVWDKEQLWL